MPSDLFPPHRELLVDQVAGVLRREIAGGRWRDWLPGERSLIKVFNVSRPTLRAALRQLVTAREIRLYPRFGYQIRSRPAPARAKSAAAGREIGLICPEKIYSMPSHVVQLVDLLRSMCAEGGLPLQVFEGRRFARTDPGRFMPRLVQNHPKACWIAIMADRRMQRWLANSGTPAVIYGNVYPEVDLSSVGIDYQACIRHAATFLVSKGHRTIALVTHDPRRAGEQQSLAGFRDAGREYAGDDLVTIVVSRPDDDVPALCRQIDRLVRSARPPTAFIVCRTHHYATVMTRVLASGRRVPADISMICRGDDTFLHFLSPTPAYYKVRLESLARKLFRSILRIAAGGPRTDEHHQVLPDFVPGASVATAMDPSEKG